MSDDAKTLGEWEARANAFEAVARNLAMSLGCLASDDRLDQDTRHACASAFRRQCEAHGITLPNDD